MICFLDVCLEFVLVYRLSGWCLLVWWYLKMVIQVAQICYFIFIIMRKHFQSDHSFPSTYSTAYVEVVLLDEVIEEQGKVHIRMICSLCKAWPLCGATL